MSIKIYRIAEGKCFIALATVNKNGNIEYFYSGAKSTESEARARIDQLITE